MRGARRSQRGVASLLVSLLGLGGIALVVMVLFAEAKLSRMVLGGLGESFSTKVFAAPFVLQEGIAPSPGALMERLDRLGYRQVQEDPAPGEYAWDERVLTVSLRGFKTPLASQEPGRYAFEWSGEAWKLRDAEARAAEQVALEPELAAELSGEEKVRREPAKPEDFPDILKKAVIAAEDKRFYRHWGVDGRAVLRALWANLNRQGAMQGGSTITQQMVKNVFLTPRRTLRRKVAEAGLAVYVDRRYGKEKILTLYLNQIYLGQAGPVSVSGMKAASRFYFGKDLSALTLGECALLAGMIRSPYQYNPRRDPDAALARRNFVLNRMREEGFLGQRELQSALAEPLRVTPAPPASGKRSDTDYYVAEVVRVLSPAYGEEALFRHGLTIHTAMDAVMQRAAQAAVRGVSHQGALVALDPHTGRVLALAGGRDFGQSQFNRATQALRQPGSAFKPFVFAAALEKGLTPATQLEDKPRKYPRALAKTWNPENYGKIYFGTTTVRQALAHSLNSATLDLADRIGMGTSIAFAKRAGIESPLRPDLATILGASEVTLLELVSAYAPFANGGLRVKPQLVTAVVDAEGQVVEFSPSERQSVIDPALAHLMTSLLTSPVTEGTARSLPLLGFTRPAAGKTGTTNEGRDAWFVGYTPELLAGVWVGDDQRAALAATGAKDALPVWAAFMKTAAALYPESDFGEPRGLVSVTIDPQSGQRALAGCPEKREELFLPGSEPKAGCPLHPGGVKGFFKRLFGG